MRGRNGGFKLLLSNSSAENVLEPVGRSKTPRFEPASPSTSAAIEISARKAFVSAESEKRSAAMARLFRSFGTARTKQIETTRLVHAAWFRLPCTVAKRGSVVRTGFDSPPPHRPPRVRVWNLLDARAVDLTRAKLAPRSLPPESASADRILAGFRPRRRILSSSGDF